jgi:hypothetical protein
MSSGIIKTNTMRYKLTGYFRWCLNYKHGWISINKYILRWNTSYVYDKKDPYILIGIFKVKDLV